MVSNKKSIKIINRPDYLIGDLFISESERIWEYDEDKFPNKKCPNCNKNTGKGKSPWACSNCNIIHVKKGYINGIRKMISEKMNNVDN